METQEEIIHVGCYVWFHNTYPELRGLLCYNNNNSKNKIDGNRNKAKGLQKGRSDFAFYYQGHAYMIELKTDTGTQSQAQKEWQQLIERHGFKYYIARSKEEFIQIMTKIIRKCLHNQK